MYSFMNEEYPEILDSPDNYYSYQYCPPYQPARYQASWSNYYNYQYCRPYQPARYRPGYTSNALDYGEPMCEPSWNWMAASYFEPQDMYAPFYGW